MIDKPGIYDIKANDYHADPVIEPSLSSSIANKLLTYSPRHAWHAHPRLNSAFKREESDRFDLGTVAHAYMLQGETDFAVFDAPSWRGKAANLAKFNAHVAGKTPILAAQWKNVQAMKEAADPQLDALDAPRPFKKGKAEQTLIWREGDVWCRCRPDWLHDDHETIDDLKTSELGNPDVWTRALLFRMGYDVQAAFYLRGLRAVFGKDAAFRFIVIEPFAPFALSAVALSPVAMELAERKVEHAIKVWRECLAANEWPAYPTRTCWADVPPWIETQWAERIARDEYALELARQQAEPRDRDDDPRPLADQLFEEES